MFGLLDAGGWGWASVKAAFWFILLIFLLGYIPDRAYYFTVNKTIDLGILAWSPVNFCPPENENLPCPAPVGAVVPWHPSPPELSLPAARTDGAILQNGTTLLFVGGSDGKAATNTTYVATTSGVGNFDKWAPGPQLPEARSNAALSFQSGKIYLIGGLGPDGKPTKTVFVLTPDSTTGKLGEWKTADDLKLDINLPQPRAGASVVVGPDGLFLVGGTSDGTTPLKSVLKSAVDLKGNLTKWVGQPDLYKEVTDASAALIGSYLWVFGGTTTNGPTNLVQRGSFNANDPATPLVDESTSLARFGVTGGGTNLPAARTNAAGFGASGALYVIGGSDGTSPRGELYWAVPDAVGNIGEWKNLPQSNLPAGGLSGGAPVAVGPNIVLVGGTTATGVTTGSARANLAPQQPFFQLGLVGATVPALKIDGEIGQQLGYLNANGAGIANFTILLIVGYAFAHKAQMAALRDRLMRRRERRGR
jgi:N-acetylneuraminic acid mutarotase